MSPEELGARCSECPLKGCKAMLGQGPQSARLVIVSEKPTQADEIARNLLHTAYVTKRALGRVGVSFGSTYRTPAIACRPQPNTTDAEVDIAARCCAPRLENELRKVSPQVILTLGPIAFRSVTGHHSLTDRVGSLHQQGTAAVVPANWPPWNPNPAYIPVHEAWVARAGALAAGSQPRWVWPKRIIQTGSDMLAAIRRMRQTKRLVAFDIETLGIDPLTNDVSALGLSNGQDTVSMPWDRYMAGKWGPVIGLRETPMGEEIYQEAKALLEDPSVPKCGQNGQHDILGMATKGVHVQGYAFDTLFAHAVLAPQIGHTLGLQAACELPLIEPWKAIFGSGTGEKGAAKFTKRDPLHLRDYNAKDALVTWLLAERYKEKLRTFHCGESLMDEYMALGAIAMRMRERGLPIDEARRGEHNKALTAGMQRARTRFEQLTEGRYTLGKSGTSPKLKELFFKELGLKPITYSAETRQPALTSADLQAYASESSQHVAEIARTVLAYRQLAKLKDTFVENLPVRNGRVHATPNPAGTRTGRWSYSSPNLQQIPKPRTRRNPQTGEVEVVAPGLRDMFCCDPALVMMEADYSQLELRIVAMVANARKLLEWYADGADVHWLNARELFYNGHGTPTDKERDLAKRIAYAFNYNASEDVTTVYQSLVTDFPSLSVDDVKRCRKQWFTAHPEIAAWQAEALRTAERLGYVEEVLSGRRIYFHDRKVDPNKTLNFPIQGFAGTLMNRAIRGMDAAFDPAYSEALLIQVHDAAVVQGKCEHHLAHILSKHMAQTIELASGARGHFPIDMKVGLNWGSMKKYKVP